MLVSGGELVLADTTPTFARQTYWSPKGVGLIDRFASYGAIYRAQMWVTVLVNKLAWGTARLPFKVYERTSSGRIDARETPYAKLLRRPNPKHDPFFFWLWTASTFFTYGEVMWVKVRGRDGRPAELWPLHPGNVYTRNEDGQIVYYFYGGASTVPQFAIPEADVVHFRTYNPDTTIRGMSPIEPLRQTLVNEDAARQATSSFWLNGARPGVVLRHPQQLSQEASDRLKAQWNDVAAGANKTGTTVVLEEGMTAERISLSAEEAQYIETRKLNREECCAAYDVPPPVVHILDRATFSNITEQMRSMYRDTMAPKLGCFESAVDHQLRPDFGDDSLYGEFLMEEVLRGAFEARTTAYQQAINSGWMMPGEVRALENLPPARGADRLFVNATLIPIDEVSQHTSADQPAVDPEVPPDPAVSATDPAPGKSRSRIPQRDVAKVANRAVSCSSLGDINPATLTAGLNGSKPLILALLEQSKAANDDIATFCALLWALAER